MTIDERARAAARRFYEDPMRNEDRLGLYIREALEAAVRDQLLLTMHHAALRLGKDTATAAVVAYVESFEHIDTAELARRIKAGEHLKDTGE